MEFQSKLTFTANRLSRIRKIRAKIKSKNAKLFQRNILELDKKNGILFVLKNYKHYMIKNI